MYKIYIKLNGENIISHHNIQDTEHTIEIASPPLNANGFPSLVTNEGHYKYKYVNGALIELTQEEILSHPNRVANKLNEIRNERNALFSECDYVLMPDSQASQNCKDSYIIYRQELRDITNNIDVDDFTWPSKPEYSTE